MQHKGQGATQGSRPGEVKSYMDVNFIKYDSNFNQINKKNLRFLTFERDIQ